MVIPYDVDSIHIFSNFLYCFIQALATDIKRKRNRCDARTGKTQSD